MREEVVEGLDADDYRREGSGNLRVGHVADVSNAFDNEVVNLGVKGGLDLGGRAAETDRHAIFCDFVYGESVSGEPICDGGDVGLRGAEVGANLVGREPLVVVGRVGVVLAGHETLKGRLLSGVAAENEDQVGHGKGGTDGAAIVLRIGKRMRVSLDCDQAAFVDAVDDAKSGSKSLSGECGRAEQRGGAKKC